jgi:hypothetical protein
MKGLYSVSVYLIEDRRYGMAFQENGTAFGIIQGLISEPDQEPCGAAFAVVAGNIGSFKVRENVVNAR